MPTFQFRADHFRATALMVSKEDARYYLIGVLIEPDPTGGIFLVATDGHRLAVFHDPNGYADRSAILACDWSSPALKIKRTENGRRVQISGNDASIYNVAPESPIDAITESDTPVDRMLFREIDGKFPDWRRVVPIDPTPDLERATGVLSFNAALLNKIVASARIVNDGSMLELFQGFDATSPMLIRFQDLPDAVYVLMPYRSTGIPATPDWLRTAVTKPEKPASPSAADQAPEDSA